MPTIEDDEFGAITLRRSAKAKHIRLRVGPDGRLRGSLPLYAPLFAVRRLIRGSRPQLRAMLEEQRPSELFLAGIQVGKSHHIVVRAGSGGTTVAKRNGQMIIVSLAPGVKIESAAVQQVIRGTVIDALRVEAKSYLPKRLRYLADQYGYTYDRVRFSHASGRWGSCSTSGTISLNIALMKLPFELIDYVLIHELSHTRQMNHSDGFWQLVGRHDPDYKLHRRALKRHNPSI